MSVHSEMDRSVPLLKRLSGVVAGAAAGFAVLQAEIREARRVSFAAKTVVITGGSRGLGLALAIEFGRAGARLVLAARDEEELDRARQKVLENGGSEVFPVVCDLTKAGVARTLIDGATRHFGSVDVLVNNASTIHVGPAETHPMESYREAMQLTYFAAVEAALAVVPQMLEQCNGSIVNIASVGGKIPVPHLAPYCGAKFGLVGFSETLHAEMRGRGIRVTTVIPGLMRTGSFPNAVITGNKEQEYRWFRAGAVTPGLSHSTEAAARKIVRATAQGRTEISIGPEVAIASRLHGLAPAVSQVTASWVQTAMLPRAADGGEPQEGRELGVSSSAPVAALGGAAIRENNQRPENAG